MYTIFFNTLFLFFCFKINCNKMGCIIKKDTIIKNNLNNIKTIPFADITKGAADMHLCSPLAPKQDCTHYCYWPLLWQQFWHAIKKYAEELVK